MIKKVLFGAVNRIFRIANTSVLDLVFGHKNRFSPLVLLTAACVQLVFSPAASALILHPASGFGAGTEIQGLITQAGHPVVGYGGGAPGLHRDTGGDGVLSAFDSHSIGAVGGFQSTTARANAALGTLGGFVTGSGFTRPVSGHGNGAFGRAFAEIYNEFTLVGPSGLTPTILLNWAFDGSFSHQTPGVNAGIATFSIVLRGAGPILGGVPLSLLVSDQVASSSFAIVTDHHGIVDVSQAFFNAGQGPLTGGDSFILDAILSVDARIDSNTGDVITGGFTADFLNSGGVFAVVQRPQGNHFLRYSAGLSPLTECLAAVWLRSSGNGRLRPAPPRAGDSSRSLTNSSALPCSHQVAL